VAGAAQGHITGTPHSESTVQAHLSPPLLALFIAPLASDREAEEPDSRSGQGHITGTPHSESTAQHSTTREHPSTLPGRCHALPTLYSTHGVSQQGRGGSVFPLRLRWRLQHPMLALGAWWRGGPSSGFLA